MLHGVNINQIRFTNILTHIKCYHDFMHHININKINIALYMYIKVVQL